MKVLVIGASGYLGHAVVGRLAEQGHELVELSRSGSALAGIGVAGDVCVPGFGLSPAVRGQLAQVDAIVSCVGSVGMSSEPTEMVNLHVNGTRTVLEFAGECTGLRRLVHVSSVLALGRASGLITNRDLSRGQTFRNWYEYAKYRAELLVRRERNLPVSVLRLGTLLGPAPAHLIPRTGGPVAALGHLLSGMPLALAERGEYPVYATDIGASSTVVARLLSSEEPGVRTYTYFDPALPTLAHVLTELCRARGVTPKLVAGSGFALGMQRGLARRFGIESGVADYARPLFRFDPRILDELPGGPVESTPDYLAETGRALCLPDRAIATIAEGGRL
ncbi:NAD-dependent epimerase/dehydratase family protein [Nocardia cyriacigeorgica]|uniref:NAD-dependent epimerase/dehydratase family protein n=1 Tax=Nocardia cyriacigeorgica TaxID=135487 RepID=UPI001894FC60|nr:SDR family oxidoreductase [Nocardia cyriacigeorgica]MBF6436580.1 SDR family oxidoreductase [Nocardia cyriacigeorgica]